MWKALVNPALIALLDILEYILELSQNIVALVVWGRLFQCPLNSTTKYISTESLQSWLVSHHSH